VIAGEDVDAALFRVCAECGKLDSLSGTNKPSEHRPWCSLRKSPDESTRNIALARSMTTEGLVLRLPAWITLGDNFAVPLLSAAALLGLREMIGGNPDHLQIVATVDPRPSGQNVDALLLHEVVPGGIGYLADFTDPAMVWDVLHRAWQVVRDCPCQHDGRLACERCLLPFTRDIKRTSRAVAERHLAGLLAGREFKAGEPHIVPDQMPWTITLEEVCDDDPDPTWRSGSGWCSPSVSPRWAPRSSKSRHTTGWPGTSPWGPPTGGPCGPRNTCWAASRTSC
jgi:hypothetical protein